MRRSFETVLDMTENEVYGRMFPFGDQAHIRELDNAGDLDEYDEEFLPGCTRRMQQIAARRGGAPAWISFTVDHDRSMDARLGFCCALTERDGDGAFGRFRLYEGAHLDKVRSMLEQSHKGLSIEFTDVVPPHVSGSLRQRVQINVSHVTATPIPVYESAGILAMRSVENPLAGGTPNLDRVRAMLAASA